MAKILLVSDTHGSKENLKGVIEIEKPFDLLVHCGDVGFNESELQVMADTPVYAVTGNTDYIYDLSPVAIFDFQGYKFFVTHGNAYYTLDALYYRAKELEADVVMFGHTHVPCTKKMDDVTLINPGSLERPRQIGHEYTYAIVEINDEKKMNITQKIYSK